MKNPTLRMRTRNIDKMSNNEIIDFLRLARQEHVISIGNRHSYQWLLSRTLSDQEWKSFLLFIAWKNGEEFRDRMYEFWLMWEREKYDSDIHYDSTPFECENHEESAA